MGSANGNPGVMDSSRLPTEAGTQDRDPLTGQPPGSVIETKEFLRTSEFWLTVTLIFGLIVAGLALDALDSPRVSLLVTILATGYVLSRGIAKAATSHRFWGRRMPHRSELRAARPTGMTDEGQTRPQAPDALTRIEARLDRLERTTSQRVTL